MINWIRKFFPKKEPIDFKSKTVFEILLIREQARNNKNWKLSDEIRGYLDEQLVFVFDGKSGQEVQYCTLDFFAYQDRLPETAKMSKRQYVEYRIQRDIKAENRFEAWLYSTRKSMGLEK